MQSISSIVFAAAAAPFVLAQQSPMDAREALLRPEDRMVPIHTADADPEGGAYGIWAAGPDYKVSFHNGMQFHPLLGSTVKTGRHLTWRTSSVRVGQGELLRDAPPTPRRAGEFRFEFEFGRVTEAYDLRVDGLEQTFVIDALPGTGDLCITGTIGGNLTARPRAAAHDALTFVDAQGVARVEYGAAIAFDADGRSVAMTTAVNDRGEVELRLAGSWLERATFPVIVDPLLSNSLLDVVPGVFDVDVFRDQEQTQSNVWVVYSSQASASDSDLYIRRYQDGPTNPSAVVYSDLNSWDSTSGQIAGVGGANRVIATFVREFGGSSGPRVRWHNHDSFDASLQTNVGTAPWTSGTFQWRPDVGGTKAFSLGTTALIVYQEESGSTFTNTSRSNVRGFLVDVSASTSGSVVGSTFGLGPATGDDRERPSVNQVSEGGGQYQWIAAWQVYDTTARNWDLGVRRITNSGPLGNPRRWVGASDHAVCPRVAGMDGRYLVTYGKIDVARSLAKPSGVRSHSIAAQRYDLPLATSTGQFPYPNQELIGDATTQLPYLLPGALAFDYESGSHWVATVVGDQPGSERLYAIKAGYRGATIESEIAYNVSGFRPNAGGVTFDPRGDRFALVWGVDTGTTGTLWGSNMTYDAVNGPAVYGTGCARFAQPSFVGWQRVGSDSGEIRLTGGGINVAAFLFASFDSAVIPMAPYGMPGCELLIDPASSNFAGSWLVFTDGAGRASVPTPIPEFMPAFDAYFQWFVADSNANTAGLLSTRGLKVEFGR